MQQLQTAAAMEAEEGVDPALRREQDRLDALDRLDILDSAPDEGIDRITRLVRRVLGVGIATVTFLDAHRQWFKSRQGLDVCETAREPAFCNHVLATERPLVIENALADARFAMNELVIGPPYIQAYAGMPLRTRDGQVIGTLCAMDRAPHVFSEEDLANLADLAASVVDRLELQALADMDGLTAVLTRSAFRREAARAFALARRHGQNLSCILLEIDHFDQVNGTQGHAVGDLVLRELARFIGAELRSSDLVGRVGEEQFAILLPQTGSKDALTTAERLRVRFEQSDIITPRGALRVTASFGLSSLYRETPDLGALLERAELAVFQAKEGGRNRCDEGPPRDVRREPRVRVLKGGRILFANRRSTVDCSIRNLSAVGAGLEVSNTADIPGEFELMMLADGVAQRCRVAWRTDRKLGVEFLGPAKPMT